MINIIVIISVVIAFINASDISDELAEKFRKMNLSGSVPSGQQYSEEEMTRLVYYEYSYESETVLSEATSVPPKFGDGTIIKARFAFDILHHDPNGDILGRYKLLECQSPTCDPSMPELYVHFVQGGQNLKGAYLAVNASSREWNLLFAIMNSIQTPAINGRGDIQTTMSPYGTCVTRFMRPEDKRFVRETEHCSIRAHRNHTLLAADAHRLTTADYTQRIVYIQNAKIDADIVLVDIDEQLVLASPLHASWSIRVNTRVHMEMTNRTKVNTRRNCGMDETADVCVIRVYNTQLVGKNWPDIMRNLKQDARIDKFETEKSLDQLIDDYRQSLFANGDTHTCDRHSTMFADLVRSVHYATADQLTAIIRNPDNNIILQSIADMLAAAGTSTAHKSARHVLAVDAPELMSRYVTALAYTTRVTDWLIDDLMIWIDEIDNDDKHKVLRDTLKITLAGLLKRRCQSSLSAQNACHNGKDTTLNTFVDKIQTSLTSDDPESRLIAMQTFETLGQAIVLPFAVDRLCPSIDRIVTDAEHESALRIIATIPSRFYNQKLIDTLVRILRNVCPHPMSASSQTLAIDALLTAVNTHQHLIGSHLLRSAPDMIPHRDRHEILRYMYAAIDQRRRIDPAFDEHWRRLLAFRVFRNNYSRRALIAFSSAVVVPIADINSHVQSDYRFNAQFANGGIFQRSRFDINIIGGKTRNTTSLMTLRINTLGLDRLLDDNTIGNEQQNSDAPSGDMQLGFFDIPHRPMRLFDGLSDLMSAVWNANGQTIKIYEGNIVLRQFTGRLPLMNGLQLHIDTVAVSSIKMLGSLDISLWQRNSRSQVIANVSFVLHAHATLLASSHPKATVNSMLTALGSITTDTDVDFAGAQPYTICINMAHSPVDIRQIFTDTNGSSIQRSRRIPGASFASSHQMYDMCRRLQLSNDQM